MLLAEAHRLLAKVGCGIGAQYQLQVMSRDKEKDLDCCKIDDDLYLVMKYDILTQEIDSLALYIFSPNSVHRGPEETKEVLSMYVLENSRCVVEIQADKTANRVDLTR